MNPVSRRGLLVVGGVGVAAIAGGAVLGTAFNWNRPSVPSPSPTPARDATVDRWVASRKVPYYVGHRGAGDVVPEHTLASYLQALDWQAECLEISVVMSSDGVLFCSHDLDLDRTTNLTGPVAKQSSTALDRATVSVPRLGSYWTGAAMPLLPRLDTVLDAVGGRAVLCIEPKMDSAYDTLVEMINTRGLGKSVMLKLDGTSPRIAMAKKAGLAVFAYLGNTDVATSAAITELAGRLDPRLDALVLPARGDSGLLDPELVKHAVGTGVPVWLFPVHRRFEVEYFRRLGAQGMISPDLGYLSGIVSPAATDSWRTGRISAGELTRDPYSQAYGLTWPGDGVIGLGSPGRMPFLTLGNVCPLPEQSYRIAIDVSYDPLPTDTWQHISIAFGHADDRYYEHRNGVADGYHALLRADGQLALYAHLAGDEDGEALTENVQTGVLRPGVWSRLTLTVTPDSITWSRDDGTSVHSGDSRFRGGYLHIGSSAIDGNLRLRNLSIS